MGQVFSFLWRFCRYPNGRSKGIYKPLKDGDQSHPNQSTLEVPPPSGNDTENKDPIPCVVLDLSSVDEDVDVQIKAKNEAETQPGVDDYDGDKVLVVVVEEKEIQKPNRKPYKAEKEVSSVKKIGHYTCLQRILLVGEGDFSFSACLAVAFGSATNIVATSLNSKEFLQKNYGNFSANKKKLLDGGAIVLHGVDATTMAAHPQIGTIKFDRIVFNFPHAGFRTKESPHLQQGRHQKLVSGFLRNAKRMIGEDGEIHITHKSNGFFLKWNIPKLASDEGLYLIQEMKFKNKYPGYRTKYGFGGDRDFDHNPSKTYKFGLTYS